MASDAVPTAGARQPPRRRSRRRGRVARGASQPHTAVGSGAGGVERLDPERGGRAAGDGQLRRPPSPRAERSRARRATPCAARRAVFRTRDRARAARAEVAPTCCEQRAGHEPQPVARVAPVAGEPARGEDRVHAGERCGDVPEREDRDGEREREAEARVEPAREPGREHEHGDELGRPERAGTSRRVPRSGRRARPAAHDARGGGPARPSPRARLARALRGARRSGARAAFRSSAARSDALGTSARIDRERRVDGGHEAPRKPAALGRERRRARLDRPRDLLDRHAPERDACR